MGCFSWNCRCGHSIMNPYAIEPNTAWTNYCVCLLPNGGRVIGMYDGYGRIDLPDGGRFEIPWEGTFNGQECFELWHLRCWKAAGEPGFESQSPDAKGQGHFWNDGDHPDRSWNKMIAEGKDPIAEAAKMQEDRNGTTKEDQDT